MSDFLNFFCCTRIKDFISATSLQKPEILIPPPASSEQLSQKSGQSLIKTLLEQRISQQKTRKHRNSSQTHKNFYFLSEGALQASEKAVPASLDLRRGRFSTVFVQEIRWQMGPHR